MLADYLFICCREAPHHISILPRKSIVVKKNMIVNLKPWLGHIKSLTTLLLWFYFTWGFYWHSINILFRNYHRKIYRFLPSCMHWICSRDQTHPCLFHTQTQYVCSVLVWNKPICVTMRIPKSMEKPFTCIVPGVVSEVGHVRPWPMPHDHQRPSFAGSSSEPSVSMVVSGQCAIRGWVVRNTMREALQGFSPITPSNWYHHW